MREFGFRDLRGGVPMRVLVTGATGFIGRALVPALRREGHTVSVAARSQARARARLGAEVTVVGDSLEALTTAAGRCDAVVNLAGEPILGRRWTAARRRQLRHSRVSGTRTLVQAIANAPARPRVLVSGSAVGYYGDRGEQTLDESAAPATGFLAVLCQDWEAAATDAERLGLRVVRLRTGVVLGRDGGALAQMMLPFRLGIGGPIGSGRQYVPWIHLHDVVDIITTALGDERFSGPINAVAPRPVTSREFASALGRALGRPAIIPVPALALRALFGAAATVLFGGQRADAAVLRRLEFPFAFPTIEGALADIIGGAPVQVSRLTASPASAADAASRRYLATFRPEYELRTTTTVHASLDETFQFFSRAENLGMLTPDGMKFAIRGDAPPIGDGVTIDYRLRIGPMPIRWQSRIVAWRPDVEFVDLQERGPYRCWWHQHSFARDGASTIMADRVCYSPPLGFVGRLANRLFIVPALRRIFQYRADVIRLRFGAPDAPVSSRRDRVGTTW